MMKKMELGNFLLTSCSSLIGVFGFSLLSNKQLADSEIFSFAFIFSSILILFTTKFLAGVRTEKGKGRNGEKMILTYLLFPLMFASYYNSRFFFTRNTGRNVALMLLAYYFPEKTHARLILDFCHDTCINDDAIYQVAAREIVGLDKNLFQRALSCWRIKHV